ncbi:MAG TPA: hypothetical protein VGB64_03945 [Actinomycetota bacterium]
MIGHVDLSSIEGPEVEAWSELMLFAEHFHDSWCVVGAQMVVLHALVHGISRPLRTIDLDILVDVRAKSPREISAFLLGRGFELDGVSADGVGHRFVRERISIDVLSIDNIGERTDTTTVPPARTILVPGGRQAIGRLETVSLAIDGKAGTIPVPDWIGALVLKSRAAISIAEHRAKHHKMSHCFWLCPLTFSPSWIP